MKTPNTEYSICNCIDNTLKYFDVQYNIDWKPFKVNFYQTLLEWANIIWIGKIINLLQ